MEGLVTAMTARYRIEHVSAYRYDQAVTASFNEVRLTPASMPWQNPLESTLRVEQSSWQYRYIDYWGTQVRVFEAQQSRTANSSWRRRARSRSTVRAATQGASRPTGWDEVLRDADAVRDEFAEFLAQRDHPAHRRTAPRSTRRSAAWSLPPGDAALAVVRAVHEAMTYLPGSTGVHTLAGEAWGERSGVCQDYAHLVVGALRYLGIPARYVSGYLHPKAEPVVARPVAARATPGCSGGSVTGSTTIRPTSPTSWSGTCRSAWAGSTTDVPPMKGIVAGTRRDHRTSTVSVSITRLA